MKRNLRAREEFEPVIDFRAPAHDTPADATKFGAALMTCKLKCLPLPAPLKHFTSSKVFCTIETKNLTTKAKFPLLIFRSGPILTCILHQMDQNTFRNI